MLRILAVCILALTVTGCASGTPRMSSTQMKPDTFKIYAYGDTATSPEQAADFALISAAAVTIGNGHTHFVVLGSGEGATAVSSMTMVGPGGLTGTGVNYAGGATLMIKCLSDDVPESAYDAQFIGPSICKKWRMDWNNGQPAFPKPPAPSSDRSGKTGRR